MKNLKIGKLSVNDFGGEGKNLIFVHAFPMSSKMWEPQVNYFKDKFRVITYDVRGLGESKVEEYQYTMETYAEDLISVIKELKLEKVNAVGLSMGGYIILRAIVKQPELFASITLADTRAERDTDAGIISRSAAIDMIKSGKRNEFLEQFTKNLVAPANYENPEFRRNLDKIISENSDESICAAMIALATRTSTLEHLPEFNKPALVIAGEYDVLTPPPMAEVMKSVLPDSRLEIIPNSGHLSNMEEPEKFNEVLLKFLNEIN
jgi:pimeloyl-ACP methyl ester carboxylesterase